MFVIGTTKVRPRVASREGSRYIQTQPELNFWMQIYNWVLTKRLLNFGHKEYTSPRSD